MKPLAIDLYCGLGGWTEGLMAEDYDVVGFDIERHDYGTADYPAQLVLQDVLTLHGRQFKDASLIVASPPCQEYSYMAMPWSRAKAIAAEYRSGKRDVKKLTALFDACFRIQREAIEAAGHFIPLVVENVRGACPWVGRSRWNYGSYHLWGDVPALMPITGKAIKVSTMGSGWYPPDHPKHVRGLGFNTHAERAIKNNGGSWFNIGSPGQMEVNRNPVHALSGLKLPGNNAPRLWEERRVKRLADAQRYDGDAFYLASSGSNARKAASAAIAKIPFPLAQHIARSWKPLEVSA